MKQWITRIVRKKQLNELEIKKMVSKKHLKNGNTTPYEIFWAQETCSKYPLSPRSLWEKVLITLYQEKYPLPADFSNDDEHTDKEAQLRQHESMNTAGRDQDN